MIQFQPLCRGLGHLPLNQIVPSPIQLILICIIHKTVSLKRDAKGILHDQGYTCVFAITTLLAIFYRSLKNN